MERELVTLLIRYGPPILFLAQVFGIFGLPIPDELLLTIAGALVAKRVLDGAPIVVAAIGGCLAGVTLSYLVGRFLGHALLGPAAGRHRRAIERARHWFARFGNWLLAFGYFIPGVRHVTAIMAGSSSLEYGTFAKYAYPGGVLWCGVFLGLGYYAGDRWPEVAHTARSRFTVGALLLVCVAGLSAIARLAAERWRLRS
jgi:membrane protein DedA with SNARE-associated domain